LFSACTKLQKEELKGNNRKSNLRFHHKVTLARLGWKAQKYFSRRRKAAKEE